MEIINEPQTPTDNDVGPLEKTYDSPRTPETDCPEESTPHKTVGGRSRGGGVDAPITEECKSLDKEAIWNAEDVHFVRKFKNLVLAIVMLTTSFMSIDVVMSSYTNDRVRAFAASALFVFTFVPGTVILVKLVKAILGKSTWRQALDGYI